MAPKKEKDRLPKGSLSDPSDEPPKADEPAKSGGKRGGVEEEQVIPVKKTRVKETRTALTLAVLPPKPQLPTSTSDDSSINMGN
eukprot:5699341-Heterocapsa_arctica.AAC.1